MTDQFRDIKKMVPITPPPELVEKWVLMYETHTDTEVFAEVGRWFADCELDACCEWVESEIGRKEWGAELRAARRPRPPSLKELALATLQKLSKDGYPCNYQDDKDWDTIRRALEQLDD